MTFNIFNSLIINNSLISHRRKYIQGFLLNKTYLMRHEIVIMLTKLLVMWRTSSPNLFVLISIVTKTCFMTNLQCRYGSIIIIVLQQETIAWKMTAPCTWDVSTWVSWSLFCWSWCHANYNMEPKICKRFQVQLQTPLINWLEHGPNKSKAMIKVDWAIKRDI